MAWPLHADLQQVMDVHTHSVHTPRWSLACTLDRWDSPALHQVISADQPALGKFPLCAS